MAKLLGVGISLGLMCFFAKFRVPVEDVTINTLHLLYARRLLTSLSAEPLYQRHRPTMSLADIHEQIAELESKVRKLKAQRETRQVEAAKSYADAFLRKLEHDQIPLSVGLTALRDLAGVTKLSQKPSV